MKAWPRLPSVVRIVGHGIDIVPVARIEQLIREHGDRFLHRTFSPAEIADCSGQRRSAERFASRFAAKEAAFKALGTGMTGGITLQDVSVVSLPTGQPTLRVEGQAAQTASRLGVSEWWVSLSDTETHSIASVIAVGP